MIPGKPIVTLHASGLEGNGLNDHHTAACCIFLVFFCVRIIFFWNLCHPLNRCPCIYSCNTRIPYFETEEKLSKYYSNMHWISPQNSRTWISTMKYKQKKKIKWLLRKWIRHFNTLLTKKFYKKSLQLFNHYQNVIICFFFIQTLKIFQESIKILRLMENGTLNFIFLKFLIKKSN